MRVGTIERRSANAAARRVLVIAQDEVERLGLVALLGRDDPDRRVLSWSLTDALARAREGAVAHPADVDCVLIDPQPLGGAFDRFEGVDVVRWLRASAAPEARILALRDGSVNPLVGIRFHEAGVDSMVLRRSPSTSSDLLAAVDGATLGNVLPDRMSLLCLGLSDDTRPGAVLQYVRSEGLETAFTCSAQLETGLSRRRIMRARAEIGLLSGLRAPVSLSSYVRGQGAGGTTPSWRAVVAYVNLARGFDCPEFLENWEIELKALR